MSKQKIEDWLVENTGYFYDDNRITMNETIDVIHQYTKNLLDRLDSKGRKIKAQEAEIKKIQKDHKALAGLVKDLRNRNRMLKALLSRIADETEDGHDKIEAWRAVAEDCRYLD